VVAATYYWLSTIRLDAEVDPIGKEMLKNRICLVNRMGKLRNRVCFLNGKEKLGRMRSLTG
jgi:hypothetical protein